MNGWMKVKAAAQYAGVSERTFREWLQRGLKHARLPSGHILISFGAIDEYLERYCETQNKADRIVDEIMREVRSNHG
jgi:excisionase family DNA binding protein